MSVSLAKYPVILIFYTTLVISVIRRYIKEEIPTIF